MTTLHSEYDPVEEIANAFLERYRRGERPSVTEYAEKHPELADEIRELIPALVAMEEVALGSGALEGPPLLESGATIPEHLGEYRIVRELGRGGMGVVYEAIQESLGRHVALKVLPYNSLASPMHLERFRREARAAAHLHHTNIVPVFGVGEHEGIHFYAMQFIRGQSLDAVLRELKHLRTGKPMFASSDHPLTVSLAGSVAESLVSGQFRVRTQDGLQPSAHNDSGLTDTIVRRPNHPAPFPASEEGPGVRSGRLNASSTSGSASGLTAQPENNYFRSVAEIGIQVADALEYAHHQGVLHRDIKPSNLLLDMAGRVWITDFGLAKTEDSEELTQPGDMLGTLRYMAPERLQGKADARSDVYGLGLTLYEMLTLQPAFADSNRQQLIQQITALDPPLPHKLDRKIPRDLETVVLKAIAKEPEKRYAGAETVAEDLRRFLADRPVKARRSSAWEKAWRWYRRNRVAASLTVVALVLLVAVAMISTLAALQLNKEQTKTLEQLQHTREAEGQATEAKDEATRQLFHSRVEEARSNRYSKRMGQRFKSLEILTQAAKMAGDIELLDEDFLQLRNEVIACLALPDLRVDKEWPGFPAGSRHFDFDDRLERYAVANGEGEIIVRRVADNTLIATLPPAGSDTWLRFSHHGQYLTVINREMFKVWKLADRPPAVAVEETPPGNDAFAFSPDDRQLAVGHMDGSISLYDLKTGHPITSLKGGSRPWHLAFHPIKSQLAVACKGSVQVRDLASGNVLVQLQMGQPENPAYPWVAWHPEGKVLAAVGEDSNIYLWDIPTKKQIGKLEGCRNGGINLTFNHAGDVLASAGWDGLLRLWDHRQGRQLFSTQAGTEALHFSPDDRLLAAEVIGNKLRTWHVAGSRAYRTLVHDPSLGKTEFFTASIHHKGRLLAVGTADGFGLWDLDRNEELAFVRLPGINHILFEPSGSLLTNGPVGLWRWPVKVDGAAPEFVHVGPPQKLPVPGTVNQIAGSRDGRVLASAQDWGAYVLLPDRLPVALEPHEDVRYVAVSPDGRWVVTGSHGKSSVKVWEAATGKGKELPTGSFGQVAFSPNGKWLATVGDGVRLWATESWEQRLRFESRSLVGLDFSPDSKMLAFETGYGIIRLIDPEASEEKEWARLEDPDQHRANYITFSPDGARLVKTGSDRIGIWDLPAIRQELVERRLEGDLPPYEGLRKGEEPSRLKVERDLGILSPQGEATWQIAKYSLAIALQPINPEAYYERGLAYYRFQQWQNAIDDLNRDLLLRPDHGDAHLWRGEAYKRLNQNELALVDFNAAIKFLPPQAYRFYVRGWVHLRLHNYDEALADFHQALQLDPNHAFTCNELAWYYVTGSKDRRAPDQALLLAQKAVRLDRKNWYYRNTLGVVFYRLGQWDAAIETLERAVQDHENEATAHDLYFLAMSYHHLRDTGKAKESLDKAVHWHQEHPRNTSYEKEELKAIRDEAEALLGKPGSP